MMNDLRSTIFDLRIKIFDLTGRDLGIILHFRFYIYCDFGVF